MTHALFLAYHFPPLGGAGVQRNAKFARYLPELGVRLSVVTGPGSARGRWTPPDPTLTAEIGGGVEVHRLPAPEPPASTGWHERAERTLGVRSPWQRWWNEHVPRVAGAVGRGVDVVYASLVPYETAESAVTLARALGKPLVLDLQDPWALDEMMIYLTRLHRRLEAARMRRALASADAVVMNTPEAARRVLSAFPELHGRVVAIPNGFDAADFAGPPPRRLPTEPFRIVHTGFLHTELGLRQHRVAPLRRLVGGEVPGVDILTRSHVYLLDAIRLLLDQRPELESALEVHLAGVLTETDREVAERSPLVRLHGYVSHHDAVALMRSADLLFLPMHNLPPGHRVGIVPGKTYDYLASGRPILAAVPDGDVRDILGDAGGAFLCRPDDVQEMARIVSQRVDARRLGEPPPPRDPQVLARFERRELSARLAELLHEAARAGDRPT